MKFALRVLCLIAVGLTGCSDEASERRAFIDFLQDHIVSRPGVHLMLMDEELAKSFGRYASHYQIILDFNSNLNLTPFERAAHLKNEISDLNDFAAHRGELRALEQALPEMIAVVDKKLETANAAHAALQQPPDLKEVYDKAFDRLVTRPGTLMQKMLALLPSSLDAMIAVGDYVAANAGVVRIVGMEGASDDPVVERHMRELVVAMHKNDAVAAELKREFQALLNGT
ncbi:MAG TPA: DUF3053 family protein [Stellaceae bacterium]|nr:DUF3053 family protein [Stellaceae bacterium]